MLGMGGGRRLRDDEVHEAMFGHAAIHNFEFLSASFVLLLSALSILPDALAALARILRSSLKITAAQFDGCLVRVKLLF